MTARSGARQYATWLLACCALTALLAAASLLVGSSDLATSIGWLRAPDAWSNTVLWQIRAPRTLGAWCAGALLALAGGLAQGLFRNPLADPYLLGSASGAALGVALSLLAGGSSVAAASLVWIGRLGITAAAFFGALRGHRADHRTGPRCSADAAPAAGRRGSRLRADRHHLVAAAVGA